MRENGTYSFTQHVNIYVGITVVEFMIAGQPSAGITQPTIVNTMIAGHMKSTLKPLSK
tara:strand:+ start:323 stop:496 length:174 start_codon:yes stop_codon:yes gene_type:complete